MTVCAYSITFFLLNFFYDDLPKGAIIKRIYYSGYTLIEYLSFAYIFWFIIKNATFKKIILVLSLFFIAFQILYYSTVRFRRLDSVPVGLETIIIFIYIIYYLFEEFKNTKNSSLYDNYLFWICIAIMFYLAGSFFFYILANHMQRAEIAEYWYLSYNADIIKNILLAISIIIFGKKFNSKNQSPKTIPYLDLI